MSEVTRSFGSDELLNEYDLIRDETVKIWGSALEEGAEVADLVMRDAIQAAYDRGVSVIDYEWIFGAARQDNRDLFAIGNSGNRNPQALWQRIETGNWDY